MSENGMKKFTAGVLMALSWVRLYLQDNKIEELKEEIDGVIEGLLNEIGCNFEVLAQAYIQNR